MKFIDRLDEMERLDALLRRPERGLAVIWGRRRVGKTRLLLEWAARNAGLYSVADQSSADVQRRYLVEALSTRLPGLADASCREWTPLLRSVAREAERAGWRGPLILDEFPYLAAASKELPSILQGWLDHDARRARLAVVIAGSSQRMMQGLVLDPSAPLFGRAVESFAVHPLDAGCLGPALDLRDPSRVVEAYAVWGGIPRYWELAEPFGERIDEAVDRCVLDPRGPLHLEPDRLLLEEVPPAIRLRSLLDVIGMGANRATEIAARVGQPVTSLGRPIARLVELGLVRRESPYGTTEKSTKRSLYRIDDPFFRFWFRVVAPHRALLAQAPSRVRLDLWHRARPALLAEAWEDLCRACVARIGRGAGILDGTGLAEGCMADGDLAERGSWRPAGRFWHRMDPEWDVVSTSLDGRRLLLGEAKWIEKPADRSALEAMAGRLVAKGRPRIEGDAASEIVHVLFVPKVRRRVGRIGSVRILTAEDVLRSGR